MKSLNDTFKIIELIAPLYNANQGESFFIYRGVWNLWFGTY